VRTQGSSQRIWNITGPNSGTLSPSITFQNIEDLRSDSGAGDRFFMHPGGSISHSIHGGNNERSVLDYSMFSTGVRVNLSTMSETVTLASGTTILPARTAPGIVAGSDATTGILALRGAIGTSWNDVLVGSSGVNILRGGAGNDELFGRSGEDILIGGDGNDRLFGDGNRDILIGGRSSGAGALGADSLDGGNGEDILIGGYTSFDAYSGTNDRRLLQIKNVWNSGDPYETRVARLRLTSTSAAPSLGGTVFDDRGNDRLTGGKGRDWFHTEPARSVPFFGTWQYDMILDRGYDNVGLPLVNEFED
jgi:Ca2+-binding RTX toxin-like protein